MTLMLHNTLTGAIEPLTPERPPEVRMYVCGLTVYNRGHIGNYRTLVASDLVRRTLKYLGHPVREVMNVTDVDDRIIKFAQDAGLDLEAFTAPHVASFEEDMRTLRMERPEVLPRATAHIPEMAALIESLIRRGHTYTVDGNIYFRIASFPDYGKLSRLDVSGIRAGARVDTDRYEKENAQDFALWKAKGDDPAFAQWDAPFGKGRPGWHIECSAMSMKYLGETFDLHCGGVDLVFPHHENEIAQSTCGTGKPFVRHWMHVQHLLVENETMSKSKGNFFTVPDVLERGHSREALRYLLLQAHYRSLLNFTWEGLDQAAAGLERIRGLLRRLKEVERPGPGGPVAAAIAKATALFRGALEQDLNTPEALAAVHGLVGEVNAALASGALTRAGADAAAAALHSMDSVFGCFFAEEEARLAGDLQGLLDARQAARLKRDFAEADRLRKVLEEKGVLLEDTPRGTRWRFKAS
jgi:cysteinyl-tRNA synthetase